MKIYTKTLSIRTNNIFDIVNLDNQLQRVIDESGVKRGFLLLKSPHTTAAIVCNEKDPDVHRDLRMVIERAIPKDLSWKHSYEGNINARAHQAATFLGSSEWVPIEDRQLGLGTWQGIFFVELFEGRNRRIMVTIVGE